MIPMQRRRCCLPLEARIEIMAEFKPPRPDAQTDAQTDAQDVNAMLNSFARDVGAKHAGGRPQQAEGVGPRRGRATR